MHVIPASFCPHAQFANYYKFKTKQNKTATLAILWGLHWTQSFFQLMLTSACQQSQCFHADVRVQSEVQKCNTSWGKICIKVHQRWTPCEPEAYVCHFWFLAYVTVPLSRYIVSHVQHVEHTGTLNLLMNEWTQRLVLHKFGHEPKNWTTLNFDPMMKQARPTVALPPMLLKLSRCGLS